jgi:hypothetical protein
VCGGLSAAQASDSLLSAIASCKWIADDRQRLQCLDAAVATIDAAATNVDDSKGPALANGVDGRERELARWEGDLRHREAALHAKSEAFNNSVSLFGITLSSGGPDSFTTAAAGLREQDVERRTDGFVEAISANIRAWSYNSRGQVTVVLDNGQVWRQADVAELHLATGWTKPHRVRISRAALGSFKMTVDGNNQGYKVRRVGPAKG